MVPLVLCPTAEGKARHETPAEDGTRGNNCRGSHERRQRRLFGRLGGRARGGGQNEATAAADELQHGSLPSWKGLDIDEGRPRNDVLAIVPAS